MIRSLGRIPTGEYARKIRESSHFHDGSFHNLERTEIMMEGASYPKIMREFFFKNNKERIPSVPVPSMKVNLRDLLGETPVIIWFGHSSYLIKIRKKNILVDPVFGRSPSPIQRLGKRYFEGSQMYTPDDLPELDAVIITHDHYDHLDYPTILKLKEKTKHFYTTLGVGSHLMYWGVDKEGITEFDWWQDREIFQNVNLTAIPARHFSGRTFKRNQTLWAGFMLETSNHKIFIGSDSGYDGTFSKVGEMFSSIDLALLECGQYNKWWPQIHMAPEETVLAGIDVKAKVVMPVHWGKFTLSTHSWKDPIERVTVKAQELGLPLTTPKIGEPITLGEHLPAERWWDYLN